MPAKPNTRGGRDIARQVLHRVRHDGAYANLALSAALSRARAQNPAEKRLATELVYGVLRHQRLLDHALSQHARQPIERLDNEVLDAMRLAAYQLLMLERVPAHAAVNDAVGAVVRARGHEMAGFTNAVLRKLGPEDLSRCLPEDPAARIAVECSLPDSLVQAWIEELGSAETRALADSLLERSPLTGRVNTLRTNLADLENSLAQEGARVKRADRAPAAFQLAGLIDPFSSATYLDGLWTVQDEAAQLVGHLLDPRPGEAVLDACAGVGGKSTHLAQLMANSGEILCIDSSERKIELLKEHCLRLSVTCCSTEIADLRQTDLLANRTFDRVLLDAPCSGLGLLGRHPELRWRLDLSSLPGLVELQRELLDAVLPSLRPGGALVYSVCTTTRAEGPEQAQWILERFPALELWPAGEGPLVGLAEQGFYRLWPHSHGTDGFFLVRFRKRAL